MFANLAHMFANLANVFANLFARCSRGVGEMFASCRMSVDVFAAANRCSGEPLPNNYHTQQSKAESRYQTNTEPISKTRKQNQKLNTATKQLPHKALKGGKPLPNQHQTNDKQRHRKAERRYQTTTTQHNQKLNTDTKQHTTQSNHKWRADTKPAPNKFHKISMSHV